MTCGWKRDDRRSQCGKRDGLTGDMLWQLTAHTISQNAVYCNICQLCRLDKQRFPNLLSARPPKLCVDAPSL